ncbi:uncharacterized protein LOC130789391 isoform X1 [Actinidia eriantha]|uniref:uncharacterized protein LOC130789391 isoform X1 n=1 Tax=Actinidia eriantha TaxID=165200 RepID=UPI002590514F|nr:uncharacterized protein LOC130789391 isoform X1 [Actinidia eriantha]
MNPLLWHKVAGLSGVLALGLGTYGAHGFKPQNPSYKEVWHTASLYHLVHTAALVAAPVTKHPNIFGGLLSTGILAFSGTVKERPRVFSVGLPYDQWLQFNFDSSLNTIQQGHLWQLWLVQGA